MRLGLVTYNIAKDLPLPELLELCERTGFEAVELRTTHAHGVEPGMRYEDRERARAAFGRSPVQLLSFGTVCEFHSPDPEVVRANIRTCHEFVTLAHDFGAVGVKVRPNGLPEGVPVPHTLRQIGYALRECGEFAQGYGVQIWLEVHGRGTSDLRHIRAILDYADHPAVKVCWNSNLTDRDETGSIRKNFRLVADRIGSVHLTDLYRDDYPWRELFQCLREIGYAGFTLAEIPESSDPERVLHYYRALWRELTR